MLFLDLPFSSLICVRQIHWLFCRFWYFENWWTFFLVRERERDRISFMRKWHCSILSGSKFKTLTQELKGLYVWLSLTKFIITYCVHSYSTNKKVFCIKFLLIPNLKEDVVLWKRTMRSPYFIFKKCKSNKNVAIRSRDAILHITNNEIL